MLLLIKYLLNPVPNLPARVIWMVVQQINPVYRQLQMNDLNKKKNSLNNYAKYSSIAMQMLVIILLGVFGGYKLDEWLNLSVPVFTVLLSLLSVVLAIYTVTKDLLKKK